ncbi:membrane protein [Marinobacterium nitratireducens]|uniref:Membrane protein n=1 Tax=Marinobacterium nitratireducens TaxID=518897 RepID=A0A917ZPM8_9GAMM|nr:permease [Marinobacterium nitratireducens]GGO87196.1 membrane protein [Marinobacterium nitratireducens]
MTTLLQQWHQAAVISSGFFWSALWAFVLGYLISSLIQVLVTEERMQRAMGTAGPRSVALGTLFGFVSSSCSFAALSTTRALFQKGAGLVPSLAFMLASTNLVIELGIVIAIFLGWQFVVGEYLGGLLLILFAWLFVRLTRPKMLIREARQRLDGDEEQDGQADGGWRDKIRSREGWRRIGRTYVMEWQMVWKDVLVGFTVAGIIAAFVPDGFFQTLFVGSGRETGANASFFEVLAQTLIGPVAAFFTFIGSMGNIPLAALLYDRGVSFAGVMAFIFSDMVVLPVLRINAAYYGWKMALYILVLLLSGLVCVSLLLHYGFALFDRLPQASGAAITERDFFRVDYGLVLNLVFIAVSAWLVVLSRQSAGNGDNGDDGGHCEHHGEGEHHHHHDGAPLSEKVMNGLVMVALVWLLGGLMLAALL